MNLSEVKSVYLLGIGGIGMSALARYFKRNGASVSGYDKTPSDLTDQLIEEGIPVHFDERTEHVTQADLYIYTPAIPKNHPAFEHVRNMGMEWFKRSQVLEWITQQSKCIAVSGTHGKTTTTAFLAHILHECKANVSAFVGGVMTNYDSNLIASPNSEYTVVEADEYDRSFLRLHPEIAIVTSLDPDHLDIYGTFEQMKADYRTFASAAKTLIVNERVKTEFPAALTYGQNQGSNYQVVNIQVVDGRFQFDVQFKDQRIGTFRSSLPGRHNVENALAAITVCHQLGIDMKAVENAVASFKGVQRRFERVVDQENIVLVDDYAHHPKEIEAAIGAARELYPNKKLSVVFQPHLYTRTRDLEDGFVDSLSKSDELILLPIYPAREEPISGVSSANLLNKCPLKTKLMVEKSHLVNAVLSLSPEVVLMLGAGDIDRLVKPLAKALENKAYVE
ncbi:MAG: UDP-N-acetylmuramate--L-alanine ligase [Flavobacteriales bacterium]